MFSTLFSYPSVLRRHEEGPLAGERARYLQGLAAQGMARGTILRHAAYCLCVAEELGRWPPGHVFSETDVRSLGEAWAAKRVKAGRVLSPKWPRSHIVPVATEFLRSANRLQSPGTPKPGRYDQEVEDFIATQQETRWMSSATCKSARWQIARFLAYLDERGLALVEVAPGDVDAYFQHMGERWSRSSLHTAGKMLRAWFAYCAQRGWNRAELAETVLLPRLYRHEELPIGPNWDEVKRLLDRTMGEDAASLRDHAIILLLSVYGVRSSEVRRLELDDIDWLREQMRIVRSKSGREETVPLEPSVGNAIVRYLREGRPQSYRREVFLTLRAPHRPLSAGGLYHVVEHHLRGVSSPRRGRGPHALRHACARRLMESGRTLKEIGDHLGHRSPDSTRIYAKVALTSLRRVALDDLGDLT